MSQIIVRRKHSKSIDDARKAVESVAEHIAERFDVEYGWEGNTLLFDRPGVHGEIALGRGEVCIEANVSFFLFAIKPAIESEIERYLDDAFG
ncbi:MAG TPA: polyhydroxyalkanoic acid system family protein [Xanthomonadaceae bacterium]|nr:polyhydroxyalkanoic acid system family protein [Xanthomonadaceae bacterium]